MLDTVDTRPISINRPVAPGYVALIHEQPIDPYISCDSTSFVDDDVSHGIDPSSPFRESPKVLDLLVKATINLIAATQLNFVRLSGDAQWTEPVRSAHSIVNRVSENASYVVALSPELVVPPNEVQLGSLIAPSGAYLTWIEMEQNELDDGKQ